MKLIDKDLLARIRSESRCCWCGAHGPVHVHHIFSKGAGRVDIACNLLPLDWKCHGLVHNGEISRSDLLAVAAARSGIMQDEIEAEVYRVRRLPAVKGLGRKRKPRKQSAWKRAKLWCKAKGLKR